ncbi:MAG: ArsR family transcriptional regulator, partial [Planctomycetota bacterium]
VLGDRRDHFEAMQDVWEMVRVILDVRKQREFDPTLAVLRELTETAAESGSADTHTHERLGEMLEFFESVAAWYRQMRRLPTGSVIRFIKAGDKLRKLLGLAS